MMSAFFHFNLLFIALKKASLVMVKPLHVKLPKTSTHAKSCGRQWMYFLIEDDNLLEKYNAIWDKVSAHIKKEFHSELAYNKNFLKTKTKSHGDEVTDF